MWSLKKLWTGDQLRRITGINNLLASEWWVSICEPHKSEGKAPRSSHTPVTNGVTHQGQKTECGPFTGESKVDELPRNSQITLPSALPGLSTQRRCMWQMSAEQGHPTELLRRQFNLLLNHACVHAASILSPCKQASQLLKSLMLCYFFLNNQCVLSALPTFLERFILVVSSLSEIFA